MTLTTVITCPLGSRCEEIKDNAIHRCAWYTQLAGVGPDGTQRDDKGCALTWLPVLLVQNTQKQASTAAAVETFRNEVVSANQAFVVAAMALPPREVPVAQQLHPREVPVVHQLEGT